MNVKMLQKRSQRSFTKETRPDLAFLEKVYGTNNEMEHDNPIERYDTMNKTYGRLWNTSDIFMDSFTQSKQNKAFMNSREVPPQALPLARHRLATVHDPRHPCGIQSFSNVPMNKAGEFTNVRRDFYTDAQGLWSNSRFNTPGATIDRGVGTYSNLQGGWGRIGPSTYDSVHGNGAWVNQWGVRSAEPATLRSLRDHRNVDPRDDWVPSENCPQGQAYQVKP